jgi:hypothetical protein
VTDLAEILAFDPTPKSDTRRLPLARFAGRDSRAGAAIAHAAGTIPTLLFAALRNPLPIPASLTSAAASGRWVTSGAPHKRSHGK